MRLTPQLADKIAATYDRSFDGALRDMLRRRGLAILTDDARRELIVKLGADRRATERRNARYRAENAAIRAADARRQMRLDAAE